MALDLNKVVLKTGSKVRRTATGAFLVLDLTNAKGYYLNAGHNSILFRDEKRLRNLLIGGSTLGYSLQPKYKIKTIDLEAGNQLMLYTDGLIENTNPKQKALNFKAWSQKITNHNSSQLLNEMMQEANLFFDHYPAEDDIAVILIRFQGQPDSINTTET